MLNTEALKTVSEKVIYKTAEASGDLIGHKIANEIMKVLRTSPQNSSETVTTETENIRLDIEISRKKTESYYCSKSNIINIIMAYKKILILSDNISNQPSKFSTKNLVEIQMAPLERITLKNKLNLRLPHSSLHDYSDEYIHVQRTKTITGAKGVGDAA